MFNGNQNPERSISGSWAGGRRLGPTSGPQRSGREYGASAHECARSCAHRAFWTALGGTPTKLGDLEVIKFPDVLVLYNKAEPTGGTEGSVVGHIGFRVKDLQKSLEKWRAAGLKTLPGASSHQAFVIAPDEIRIEMTEDSAMEGPIANHHIHFYTSSVDETKAWYVKKFGAKPGKRGPFEAADVPGVNLTFSQAKDAVAGTKGRALGSHWLRNQGPGVVLQETGGGRSEVRPALQKDTRRGYFDRVLHRSLGNLHRIDRGFEPALNILPVAAV